MWHVGKSGYCLRRGSPNVLRSSHREVVYVASKTGYHKLQATSPPGILQLACCLPAVPDPMRTCRLENAGLSVGLHHTKTCMDNDVR